MGLAAILWTGVLAYLLTFEGVPTKVILATLFFVVFFGLALTYYGRSAIFVDADGVTYRGMVRTRRLPFQEIRKLDVLPGVITVYAIRTPRAFCHFTSFFRHHRKLADLLVERAGLAGVR
jgi:hypothetical protein